MNYEVVFDVTKDGLRNWQIPLIPVVILILVAINYIRKKDVSRQAKYATLVGVILIVFQLAVSFYSIVWRYLEYSYKLKSGNYSVAEGYVSNFILHQEESMEGIESFSVEHHKFAYKENLLNFSFDYPGIIKDSVQVRIQYSNKYILKLEVAQKSLSAP